jgi:hypothetical protein
MTTLGDMIYEGAGPSAIRLGIGSTSQVLTVVGGVPAWATPASGGVTTISFGSTGLTPSTATSGAVSVAGTLAVANGGTGATTSTGSGAVVLATSPTLTTPNIGTPSAGTLTSCTGLPITAGTTGTLGVARGGTGLTATPTNGQIPIGNGTGFTLATLTKVQVLQLPTLQVQLLYPHQVGVQALLQLIDFTQQTQLTPQQQI